MAKAQRKAEARRERRTKWYDQQPQSYKNANKRPGSCKKVH